MDSRKYDAVLKVSECGTISAAAQELGCTQSCLSRMISRLEHEIGFSLFSRECGKAVLSENGEILKPAIADLLQAEQMLMERIDDVRENRGSHIRLVACSDLAANCLPEVISSFLVLHPGLSLDLKQTDDPALMHELLSTDQADFAFCFSPLPECEWKALGKSRLLAVFPQQEDDGFSDLPCKDNVILPQSLYTDEINRFLEQYYASSSITRSSLDTATIIQMVEHRLAVSILPALCMRTWRANVSSLPLEPSLYQEYGVALCERSERNNVHLEFLSFASQNLSNQIA